jgi:hypothetical protein
VTKGFTISSANYAANASLASSANFATLAAMAGTLSNLNISQFTNDSAYLTATGTISTANYAGNAGLLNGQAASYYTNAANINNLPVYVTTANADLRFLGISAVAVDSAKLNNQSASYYTNASNIDSGTLSLARLHSDVVTKGFTISSANYATLATTAGTLSNLNISQFTNDSAYLTATGTISTSNYAVNASLASTANYAGNAGLLNGQAASYYTNAANINNLPVYVTTANADLRFLGISAVAVDSAKLNNQSASYYTNASNIDSGTLALARLHSDVVTKGFTISSANYASVASLAGSANYATLAATAGTLSNLNISQFTNDSAYLTATGTISTSNYAVNASLASTANYAGNAGLLNGQAASYYTNAANINNLPVYVTTANADIRYMSSSAVLGIITANADARYQSISTPLGILTANADLRFLGISAVAVDSAKLNNQSASYYTNASNIDSGTLALARLHAAVVTTGMTVSSANYASVASNASSANYATLAATAGTLSNLNISQFTNDSAYLTATGTISTANYAGNAGLLNGQAASYYTNAANINNLPVYVTTANADVRYQSISTPLGILTANADLRFLGINAVAVDSAKLNNQSASYYTNASNIDSGTLALVRLNAAVVTTGMTVSSANYSGTAGTLSNLNISQFANDSAYLTATGTISTSNYAVNASLASTANYAGNAGLLNGQAASYYTNAANINSLPVYVTTANADLRFLGINAVAVDSAKLNNQSASYYTNASNIDSGTLSLARLHADVVTKGFTISSANYAANASLAGSANYATLAATAGTLSNLNISQFTNDSAYLTATGTISTANYAVAASQASSSNYAVNAGLFNGQAASFYTNAANIQNLPVYVTTDNADLRYLGINAVAVDSAKLNNQGASYYTNASNLDSGTVSLARLNAAVVTTGMTVSSANYATLATTAGTLSNLNISQFANDSAYLTAIGTISTANYAGNAGLLNGQSASYYTNANNLSNLPSFVTTANADARYLGLNAVATDSARLNGQAASYYTNASNIQNLPVYITTDNADLRFLGINAVAVDSAKLNNQSASYYTNASNLDSGTLSLARLHADVVTKGIIISSANYAALASQASSANYATNASLASSANFATLAATAGTLSNLNISQFTNDSAYLTATGTISTANYAGNAGLFNGQAASYYTNANNLSNLPSFVTTANADIRYMSSSAVLGIITANADVRYQSMNTPLGILTANADLRFLGINAVAVDSAKLNNQSASYYTNASNIDSGTLSLARLHADVVTKGFTISSANYATLATTAGTLSNLNVSQFTNDSAYLTATGTISTANYAGNAGLLNGQAASYYTNATNINNLPVYVTTANADLRFLGINAVAVDSAKLNNQSASYYTNASNLDSGTLSLARLHADVVTKGFTISSANYAAVASLAGSANYATLATTAGTLSNLNISQFTNDSAYLIATGTISTSNYAGNAGLLNGQAASYYTNAANINNLPVYVTTGNADLRYQSISTPLGILTANADLRFLGINAVAVDSAKLNNQSASYYTNASNIDSGTLSLARLHADVVTKGFTISSANYSGTAGTLGNLNVSQFINDSAYLTATGTISTANFATQANTAQAMAASGLTGAIAVATSNQILSITAAGNFGIGDVPVAGKVVIYDTGTSSRPELLVLSNNGLGENGDSVGLGFLAGAYQGVFPAGPKASIGFTRTSSYGRGDLIFMQNSQGDLSGVSTADEVMRITNYGDVGIGVKSPSAKLEVAGTVSASTLYVNGVLIDGSGGIATANADVRYLGLNATANNALAMPASGLSGAISVATSDQSMTIVSAGNIGIGTANPTAKLHVAGPADNQAYIRASNFQGVPSAQWPSFDGSAPYLMQYALWVGYDDTAKAWKYYRDASNTRGLTDPGNPNAWTVNGTTVGYFDGILNDLPSGTHINNKYNPKMMAMKCGQDDTQVKIGSYWVDKYANRIIDVTSSYAGTTFIDDDDGSTGPAALRSSANVNISPFWMAFSQKAKCSTSMTWFVAAQAAVNAGKRIISNDEWQEAAGGTARTDATGGTADGSSWSSVSDQDISRYGVVGMAGNVEEWVKDWGQYDGLTNGGSSTTAWGAGYGNDSSYNPNGRPSALIRGGSWNHDTDAGIFAQYPQNAPADWGRTVGFRSVR